MKTPFLYFAVSLSFGIAAANFLHLPLIPLFALSAFFAVISLVSLKHKILSHISLYLAIFFLGALSLTASDILSADHVSKVIKGDSQNIILKGLIIDDPATTRTVYKDYKTTFTLKADSCKFSGDWIPSRGLVKVDLYSRTASAGLAYGDRVVLEGRASRPAGLKNPGLFDYSKYLELYRIYLILNVKDVSSAKVLDRDHGGPLKKAAYYLRRKISGILDRYSVQPALGFLKAVIVGDREDLGRALSDDFIKTGTVHIISVSGTHVALIACIFIFLFRLVRIPKKTGIAISAALVLFYSFIVGLNPPIIRSVIMFAIFALGYIMDREGDILNSLAVAAFLILLWSPKELFDPSFQLSFGSIASIIMISPAIERIFSIEAKGRLSKYDKARLYLVKGISVSAAAWLGVAPIVAYYFNIISPVSIAANLVVIPAVSLVMIMAFAFVVLACLSAAIASFIAPAITLTCSLVFGINHLLAKIPFSYMRSGAPSWQCFAAYYALIWLFVAPKPIMFRGMKITNRHVAIITLLFLNISVWAGDLRPGRKDLEITFFDVGKGDSILMEFPGKGTMLIDTGPGGNEEKFDAARSVVAPSLWNKGIRRLDALVVTHSHEDHLGGALYLLENFEVGSVIDNGVAGERDILYKRYRDIVKKKKAGRLTVSEGDTLEGFGDAKIYILNPPEAGGASDPNESSIVMKIVRGNSSALLCGDASGPAIDRLQSYGDFLRADILKLPHHGGFIGGRDRVRELFARASPKVCIVTTGESGRMDREVAQLIKSSNLFYYETKNDGAIKVVLDGKSFTVRPNKGNN